MKPLHARPRNRKQLLLKLGVFLLLGAIVNAAVAWGLTLQRLRPASPDKFVEVLSSSHGLRLWHRLAAPDWPSEPETCKKSKGIGHERVTAMCRGALNGRPDFFVVNEEAYGLPMGSIGFCSFGKMTGRIEYRWVLCKIESNPPTWGARWILPYKPLWPGFAINSVFYAALLWVLIFAPGKIRRFVRVRGHRCPACGYKIDSAPGIGPRCSECGSVLPLPLGEGRGEGTRGEG